MEGGAKAGRRSTYVVAELDSALDDLAAAPGDDGDLHLCSSAGVSCVSVCGVVADDEVETE
jgi:hypothetical protein